MLVVVRFGNQHALECGQRSQKRAADPSRVQPLRRLWRRQGGAEMRMMTLQLSLIPMQNVFGSHNVSYRVYLDLGVPRGEGMPAQLAEQAFSEAGEHSGASGEHYFREEHTP